MANISLLVALDVVALTYWLTLRLLLRMQQMVRLTKFWNDGLSLWPLDCRLEMIFWDDCLKERRLLWVTGHRVVSWVP